MIRARHFSYDISCDCLSAEVERPPLYRPATCDFVSKNILAGGEQK